MTAAVRPHRPAARAGRLGLALAVLAVSAACTSSPPPDPVQQPQPVLVTPGPGPAPGATGAPAIGISTLPPVPVGEPAAFGGGLVATVMSITSRQVDARGPGEIAGPGVAVAVRFTNEASAPLDLDGVTVNAFYGAGVPATTSSAPPAAPASGVLDSGRSGNGTYLFQLPADQTESVTVEINYNGSPNVVLVDG